MNNHLPQIHTPCKCGGLRPPHPLQHRGAAPPGPPAKMNYGYGTCMYYDHSTWMYYDTCEYFLFQERDWRVELMQIRRVGGRTPDQHYSPSSK